MKGTTIELKVGGQVAGLCELEWGQIRRGAAERPVFETRE